MKHSIDHENTSNEPYELLQGHVVFWQKITVYVERMAKLYKFMLSMIEL